MNQDEIQLRIIGKKGNESLVPANFDIAQIRLLFDTIEALLYPDPKSKKSRPVIAYEIREGSVVNIFKTSLQSVLALSAIFSAIEIEKGSIDRLETSSARAIETLQAYAIRNDYTIEIATSDKPDRKFVIDRNTRYERHENIMVDVEDYYYGILVDAGGKDKANIHLDTKEAGLLTIKANKDYLSEIEGNPLYRKYGARVKAKQNANTGDIDKSSLELLELIDYSPKFDEDYLKRLISRASPKWKGIDANVWLANMREGVL